MDINALDQIDQDVKDGKIQGNTLTFPSLTGNAFFYWIDLKNAGNNSFLEICLALEDNPMTRKTFSLWLPQPGSNDNAKFMAMQRIYNSVFAACKKDSKSTKISDVFNGLQKLFETKSILVSFNLQERKSFSEKTGKEYVNQDLEALTHLGFGNPIPRPQKQEARPAPAIEPNWGNDSDIPF